MSVDRVTPPTDTAIFGDDREPSTTETTTERLHRLRAECRDAERRILTRQIDRGARTILDMVRFSPDPLDDVAMFACDMIEIYKAQDDLLSAALLINYRLSKENRELREELRKCVDRLQEAA